MTRPACLAPGTVDREGGDCAHPDCQAHHHNEDGPDVVDLVGHLRKAVDDARARRIRQTTCNPDHDTACRCPGCRADPYVDPAG